MAWSPPSLISTKANPRGRPVSRSMMTWTLVTVPYWENTSRSWSSVVEKDMLQTYKFLATVSPRMPVRAESNTGETTSYPGVARPPHDSASGLDRLRLQPRPPAFLRLPDDVHRDLSLPDPHHLRVRQPLVDDGEQGVVLGGNRLFFVPVPVLLLNEGREELVEGLLLDWRTRVVSAPLADCFSRGNPRSRGPTEHRPRSVRLALVGEPCTRLLKGVDRLVRRHPHSP